MFHEIYIFMNWKKMRDKITFKSWKMKATLLDVENEQKNVNIWLGIIILKITHQELTSWFHQALLKKMSS
jgi:hypothetical protein